MVNWKTDNFAAGAFAGFVGDFTITLIPTIAVATVAIVVPKEEKWREAGWGAITGAGIATLLKLLVAASK